MADSSWSVTTRKWIKHHLLYRYRVTYLRGTVFNESDLERAGAETARAVYLWTNRFKNDDTPNVLRVLALQKHLRGVPIYVLVNKATSRDHILAAGVPFDNVWYVPSCGDETSRPNLLPLSLVLQLH